MNEGGTAEAFKAFAPYWGGGFFIFRVPQRIPHPHPNLPLKGRGLPLKGRGLNIRHVIG
jgi:hypothetical protein